MTHVTDEAGPDHQATPPDRPGAEHPTPPAKGARQIQIELGEKEAEGTYSNLVILTHSPSEFVLDFARVLPGRPKAKVYTRVIMTPQNAKSFLAVLQKNLETYETKHGKIAATGDFSPPREIGFK